MDINTSVSTTNPEYGNGTVVFVSEDKSLCSIKFDNKPLPIMCSMSSKKSVHLDGTDNVSFKIIT